MKRGEKPTPSQFSRRILVVEDDEGLRGLICRTLRKTGFETEEAPTAAGAIEHFAADPALILVVDQCLPDMTGRGLVTTLRERGLDPSFIIMTGQGDERLAVDMMKLGAFDYLIKDTDLYERLPLACAALARQLETAARLQAAEQALSASEQRYKSITEQLTEMLFIHDLQGNILEINQAAADGMGFTHQELLGMTVFDLHTAHEGEYDTSEIQRQWVAWPVGNRVVLEREHRRKDGRIIPVEIITGKVILDGSEVVIAIVHDITERKAAEEKITRQVEELQRWHKITMDREERILLLKGEVNRLLREKGIPPRYASAKEGGHD